MKNKNKINKPIHGKVAKVPVIMQMEALECGAACLAMILAYYGKWISLEQVRSNCGVSRDGSKAINIVKAARSYGLKAAGFRYEPINLKDNATFPCIIHWNFNHFVVLRGFRGNKAYINDPARGDYSVSIADFDKAFTGICLIFSPTENFVPGGKQKSVIDFARKRLVGAGVAVAFVTLTTIISSLLGVINPIFSRLFLDYLLPGKNPQWLIPFIIGLSSFSVIQIVVAWIQAVYSLRINGKLAVSGSASYIWRIFRLPMEFFSQRTAGDIQQREGTNASISNNIVQIFAPLILQTIMMIFYLFVMLRYSLILTVVGVLSIIINIFVARIISNKRVNITRVQMRDSGKLYSATVAGIEMIETIKSTGAEDGYFERWSGYQASVNTQNIKFVKLNQHLGMVPGLVSSLTGNIILMIGVWLTIKGQFTVGMITAFQGFLTSFTAPANELISAGQTLQQMRTQMERIEDVMEYPLDLNYLNESNETDIYHKLTGNIEIKNLNFGYSSLEPPLIKDFNLTLKAGSKIAFVGSSGCGKSTLSKLISGLYKPWSGEILYDGKNIADIPRAVFTGSVSVVDQDIILFNDTIENNIKMWDNTIEDFEMILAARDAQIHNDIMERADGYRHTLLEGGKDFSGGQRQRIEIARALAQDPTIIILDEATSALDAKTEYDVTNAIKDRGITCIVVAHRLSTIRDCDEIIVLDDGIVVERGTHNELYEKNGIYRQLVSNE